MVVGLWDGAVLVLEVKIVIYPFSEDVSEVGVSVA